MATATSLRESLLRDHDEIDRGLADLVRAYETGDHQVAREAFRAFDARLAAHFAFEDEHLLPAFGKFDPQEAQAIAGEHRAIRTYVDELGIGTDLHLTRLPAIKTLVQRLRAHARREDLALYRWVDEQTWSATHDLFVPAP
jgi:hemerythrin HHE cation binding domain-containing protein